MVVVFLPFSFGVMCDTASDIWNGTLHPWPYLTMSTDTAPDLKKSVESSTSGMLGRIRFQAL